MPRVAALIEQVTGVRYHPGHVWRLLGALGFSCQRPERRAVEPDEPAIRHWKRVQWPAIKKSASAGPRDRLPRRKRPEHPTHRGADVGSAWADPAAPGDVQLEKPLDHWGIGPVALLLLDARGQHQGPQVIAFLQHLQRHIPGKVLILWDGASIHRTRREATGHDWPPSQAAMPHVQLQHPQKCLDSALPYMGSAVVYIKPAHHWL